MKTFSGIGLLFLLLSLFGALQQSYADPPLPTPIGRVVWIKGSFKAIMPNKEVRALQKMSIIYLHDTLVTEAASQAEIVYTDNTLQTFRENTSFSVDNYSYKPKSHQGSYVGNVIEGGFRTITGLIAKNQANNYTVNTPVATIGIRGTDFAIYYNNGKLYMVRYKGTPCLKTKNPKDPKKKNELCLDQDHPYATVPGPGEAPVALAQLPDPMNEVLLIIPATISPFFYNNTGGGNQGPGGTITSFCITQ